MLQHATACHTTPPFKIDHLPPQAWQLPRLGTAQVPEWLAELPDLVHSHLFDSKKSSRRHRGWRQGPRTVKTGSASWLCDTACASTMLTRTGRAHQLVHGTLHWPHKDWKRQGLQCDVYLQDRMCNTPLQNTHTMRRRLIIWWKIFGRLMSQR